jgi:electron transfer flavoprotein alpha subunit
LPDVIVYSGSTDLGLELVTLGSKFGDVSVVVAGSGDVSDKTRKLSVPGVAKIYEISHDSLKDLLAGPLVDALEMAYKNSGASLFLIGSTKRGKEIAPRLATRLKLGCVTDAMTLASEGSGYTCTRLVWGGNAIATVSSKGAAVVTVPAKAYERATGSANPAVEKIDFTPRSMTVTLIGRKQESAGAANIKDADIVVSAGRGFKKKEDLAILEELAKVLNAVVGASRPLTSDLAWMPEDRQVGLSGTTVKPKLYIAVGISGQIQHLTGMRDSKIIAAINSDKNAPIFQECDYGVLGDLYAIVPELTKVLKYQLGR